MKRKSTVALLALAALPLLAALHGCATKNDTAQARTSETALVCPECKTVTLGPYPTFEDSPGKPTGTIERHECAGCRGILSLNSTKEWFRHECSVCKQSPFACKPTATP